MSEPEQPPQPEPEENHEEGVTGETEPQYGLPEGVDLTNEVRTASINLAGIVDPAHGVFYGTGDEVEGMILLEFPPSDEGRQHMEGGA